MNKILLTAAAIVAGIFLAEKLFPEKKQDKPASKDDDTPPGAAPVVDAPPAPVVDTPPTPALA